MSDEQPDALDEAAFDELSPEESYLVAVPAQLAAIADGLHRIADALEDGEAAEGGGPEMEWQCRSCGDELPSEEDAEQHARLKHDAPGDAWRACMERL